MNCKHQRVALRIYQLLAIGLLFVLARTASVVHAQGDITFTAQVDRTTLSLDEQLTLQLVVRGAASSVSQPRLPSLEGFQVVSSGSSQQFSFVNGQMSAAVTFTYVLQPTAEGRHTIGPAEVAIGGQVYRTQPIEVEVTAGRVPTPTPQEQTPSAQAPSTFDGSQDLHVEMVVDDETPYVGQQVVMTFRFYQGVDLFGYDLSYDKPATSGFWAEDIPGQNQYRQRIGGRPYLITELKTALFPTAAGPQTVGPATLELSGFFNQHTLVTDPLTVQAQPLPEEGRPSDFGGAVGQYQISASLDRNETKANEPVTLVVKVTGMGNIQTVPEPVWPDLPDFRSYDARVTRQTSVRGDVVHGEKTFEKLLIPKKTGQYTIPPFRLSTFDPQAGAYYTAETGPLVLTVQPGAPEPTAAPGVQQQDVAVIGRDIRHIKAAPPVLRDEGRHLYQSGLFLASWAIPPLVLLVAALYQRERRRLREDVGYARLRRAHRVARRRLARAKGLSQPETGREFHAEVARAVTEYLGDKMNVPAAGLTMDAANREMEVRGIDPQLREQVRRCWEAADVGRFAPVAATVEDMQQLLSEAEETIVALEGCKWDAK